MAEEKKKPMTAAEMREQARKLQEEADRVEAEERRALRDEVEQLVQSRGYTLADIFNFAQPARQAPQARKTGRSRSDLPPTHRDPAEPLNTWTGRGRKPKWLVEYLGQGRSEEEFRIAN